MNLLPLTERGLGYAIFRRTAKYQHSDDDGLPFGSVFSPCKKNFAGRWKVGSIARKNDIILNIEKNR